jgi:hypothetical protein
VATGVVAAALGWVGAGDAVGALAAGVATGVVAAALGWIGGGDAVGALAAVVATAAGGKAFGNGPAVGVGGVVAVGVGGDDAVTPTVVGWLEKGGCGDIADLGAMPAPSSMVTAGSCGVFCVDIGPVAKGPVPGEGA